MQNLSPGGSNWSVSQSATLDSGSEKCAAALEFVASEGLTQFVTEPTHVSGNVLDLVFGTDPNLVKDLYLTEPLATSDHLATCFAIPCGRSIKSVGYDFRKSSSARSFF